MRFKTGRFFLKLVALLLSAALCVGASFVPTMAAFDNYYTNTGNFAVDISGIAATQLGFSASGGTSKYGEWLGDSSAAWAGAFISWCADQAGIPVIVIPRTADLSAMLSFFTGKDEYFSVGEKAPAVGDIAFYTAGDSQSAGIVTAVSERSVTLIAGDVNGEVIQKDFDISEGTQIDGWAVPDYGYLSQYTTGIYVLTAAVNFRSGPDTTYNILTVSGSKLVMPVNTMIRVTEVRGSWGRAVYSGMTGWFCLDYADMTEALEQGTVTWKVVDVSRFQPESSIDWSAIKAAGVTGVILRLGGRYYGSVGADMFLDSAFDDHYAGATAAGLKIGVYFFSSATTATLAKEEADYVLDKLNSGSYTLEFPVYIDIEDINDGPTTIHRIAGREACSTVVNTFCAEIADGGYLPGVYTNTSFASKLLDPYCFVGKQVWIADYRDTCAFTGNYGMWQYTSTGRISGYSGPLDISYCYINYPEYVRDNGWNGFGRVGSHICGSWETVKAPSCTQYGLRQRKCTDCGIVLQTEAIAPAGHRAANVAVETADGTVVNSVDPTAAGTDTKLYRVVRCSVCGEVLSKELIYEEGEHTAGEYTITTEATCTREGEMTCVCKDCGEVLGTKIIPMKEHAAGVAADTAPTCTAQGQHTLVCPDCGYLLSYEYVDPLGHKYGDWVVTKAADLGVTGTKTATCSVCGDTITEDIPMYILGDPDYDGKLTSADARLILRASVSLETLSDIALRQSDINGDGAVSAEDARTVLRASLGLDHIPLFR